MEEAANNVSRQNITSYQAQINNNNDDDFYADEPVLDPALPPLSPPPSPPNSPPASSPPLPPPPLPPPPGPAGLPEAPVVRHYLGPMNLECPDCHALHFVAKKLSRSTRNHLMFGMCYLTGQIDLPPFPPAPRELRDLFDGTSPHSLEFKTNICQYNIAFAFTSLGVNIDDTVLDGYGPYSGSKNCSNVCSFVNDCIGIEC